MNSNHLGTFKKHWNLFLRECAKRREKEAHKMTTHKVFFEYHFVQQLKHQFRHNINRQVMNFKEMGDL